MSFHRSQDIFNFLYLSRDYLALLLSWFFYEITLNENKLIYQNVIKEISSINSCDDYKQLKYLEKCLYETLRLHPIKPWIIRQAMKSLFIPSTSNQIKKNDLIALPLYALGRNDKIWKDPLKFKPSRFDNNKDKFKEIFFGINNRSCLGKEIGINAAKIYIYNILKDYDILPKPEQKIAYAPSIMLHMKHSFCCKLVKRS